MHKYALMSLKVLFFIFIFKSLVETGEEDLGIATVAVWWEQIVKFFIYLFFLLYMMPKYI